MVLEMTSVIPLIIPLPQHLQPSANPLQVCDCFVARDVIHFRMTAALRKLPELKVLGEFCITV
jgi:hypothetical protein